MPMQAMHPNRYTIATECEAKAAYYKSITSTVQPQMLGQKKIPAHEWSAVCDSMLGGLAAKLRMCGCNCSHLVFDQGGERAVKRAVTEKRVFLTRNKGYLKVRPIFISLISNLIRIIYY